MRDDRCVTVMLRPTAVASLWVAVVGLMGWYSVGGPPKAGAWAIVIGVAAGAWTIIHFDTVRHRMLRQAFDLGRETGQAEVRNLR